MHTCSQNAHIHKIIENFNENKPDRHPLGNPGLPGLRKKKGLFTYETEMSFRGKNSKARPSNNRSPPPPSADSPVGFFLKHEVTVGSAKDEVGQLLFLPLEHLLTPLVTFKPASHSVHASVGRRSWACLSPTSF